MSSDSGSGGMIVIWTGSGDGWVGINLGGWRVCCCV